MFNKTERAFLLKLLGKEWSSLEVDLYAFASAKIGRPYPYSTHEMIAKRRSRKATLGKILNKLGVSLPVLETKELIRKCKVGIPRLDGKPEYRRVKGKEEMDRLTDFIVNQ